MDQGIGHQSLRYFCKCQNVYLSASLLSNHLQLPYSHRISRVDSENTSSEYFEKSILNRIDSISNIQTKIQQSSNNLTQALIINTTFAINKLNYLIRLYRNILKNPPVSLNLQKKEIISTFYVDKSINQAVIDHFNQGIIAERLTADRKKEIINSKILELFTKRSANFRCMALFNSEKFIVTGGTDGFIRIWDTKSNTQSCFFKKHRSCVTSVAIGLGDNILLSGSLDCSVILWDLKSLKMIHKFEAHSDGIRSVLISKNNKFGVSGSWDGKIKIWNLEKKEVRSTFSAVGFINKICLFDEDKMLAVAGDPGVMFWSLSNQSKKIVTHKYTSAMTFSKNEHYFIIGDKEGFIQIWASTNQQMIFEDRKHSQEINSIAFSHDSLIFATCSNDEKVLIWDFTFKKIMHSINYDCSITSILFFKNSETLAICSLVTEIYFYKLNSKLNEKKIYPKELKYIKITLSSDLSFMAYGFSKIILFDLGKRTKISKISHLTSDCAILKFTQDNKFLGSGHYSGEVIVFGIPSLMQVYKLYLGKSIVKCLAFSASTEFVASAYKEGKLFVQSIENKKVVYKENLLVNSLVFCQNSEKLIYSFDEGIIILDKNFKKVAVIKLKYTDFIFLSKNDKTVFVQDIFGNICEIEISTGKKICNNQRKRDLKKRSSQDQRLHLFLLWPGISLS